MATPSELMNRCLEPPVFPALTSLKPSPVKSLVNSFQVKSLGLLRRRFISFSCRVILTPNSVINYKRLDRMMQLNLVAANPRTRLGTINLHNLPRHYQPRGKAREQINSTNAIACFLDLSRAAKRGDNITQRDRFCSYCLACQAIADKQLN